MSITRVIVLIAAACGLLACGGSDDSGKTCSVGKPCGDTCIAKDLTCHQ
jgi:hypothetical protein